MSRMRMMEILVGAFMAAGFVALFFLAMKVSNLSAETTGEGYPLIARFDNVGSLKARAAVTMAGVRLGRVQSIRFDKSTYEAVVTLSIDNQYNTIPVDTFASIYTQGLLGEQYIGLSPGGSEEYLHPGDELTHTQSALVLEQLIGQYMFKKAGEGSTK
jgi:phospholipid/cholesterol/gamma-HCH transport system substrate-binding protein